MEASEISHPKPWLFDRDIPPARPCLATLLGRGLLGLNGVHRAERKTGILGRRSMVDKAGGYETCIVTRGSCKGAQLLFEEATFTELRGFVSRSY